MVDDSITGGMAYRMLGNTGLQVSVLSYGFWATFGVKADLKGDDGVLAAMEILRATRRHGLNFFDNAEVYGAVRGDAERVQGEAMARLRREDPETWRRSDLVLSTKIFWGGDGVNEKGLSRKHVREGLEASLARLQVDYVDVLFCHNTDPLVPTESVVRTMTEVVRSGLATCWGTSEWSAQQITEAFWIARTYGLEPPQVEQPEYNLLNRNKLENEYVPLFQQPYGLGTTIWSPLASGFLTGKYNDSVPAGSRATIPGYDWLGKRLDKLRADGTLARIVAFSRFAEDEVGCTPAQLALAWCLRNGNVSTAMFGATSVAQVEANVGALPVARRLTNEHFVRIDDLMGTAPPPYRGWGGRGGRTISTLAGR